ncbi:F-box protein At5g07610-like [Rutidosis leptorrhynchoides]|uniref:F-box protein At5g07610-like n=1 Tax=Rutidosis leptorrhynchoides TaxID=125765 RepID=UPI003A9A3638
MNGTSPENYPPETDSTLFRINNGTIASTCIHPIDTKNEIKTNSNSTPCISSTNSSACDLIASSQDLLTEIFHRLPVISVIQLMSVSKNWYNFIKSSGLILRNPNPNLNPNPNPPSGLFFEGVIKILQSCNGLLLCANDFQNYYVYNPTTKCAKTLPLLNNYNPDSVCCMALAFDPAKSCEYKVVCSYMYKIMMIEIYSSRTKKWKSINQSMDDLVDVDRGVYGHNAIHWMSFPNRLVYLKLDEELLHYIDIDTPDTTIYGTILDEFLAESSDGMLLVVRCCRFRRLNVYEIKKDYSDWSIKYHVDLEEVIRVYPSMMTRLGLHFVVQCLVLGVREEDSFIVLELPGKLIQYKFVLNTISQLYDFSNESRRVHQGGFFPKTIFQLSDFTPENRRFINGNCFHFIPCLAAV